MECVCNEHAAHKQQASLGWTKKKKARLSVAERGLIFEKEDKATHHEVAVARALRIFNT